MAWCDFVVKYNPEEDDAEDLTRRILFSIWVKRIKHNKPVNVFIGGDSGEGKSFTVLRLQELLCEIQGLDHTEYMQAMNVFTPLEYPEKLDPILYDKELKKVNMIAIHEARDLVRAKNWQQFMTQAISDVNAQARSVKRLMTFIVSQFIRDITTDMRYTLNFYCTVSRPKGKKARLYINVLWKDDRDLERPKLRKRKLSGYLVYPNGRYQRFVPQYLELSKPAKETTDLFERLDRESKSGIIRKKLDRLIDEMKTEMGMESEKVEAMVSYYKKHPDQITTIGKRYRGKWKMTKESREMHDLSRGEVERFERLIREHFEEEGALRPGEEREDKRDAFDLEDDGDDDDGQED